MADPRSSLKSDIFNNGGIGQDVTLLEKHPFSLIQIAAWPETFTEVSALAADWIGCADAPDPGHALIGPHGNLLRVEPLKWWFISENPIADQPEIADKLGAVLDMSHSRTWVRINGARAETLLNHFLPLDLRDGAFPIGAVASTAFHHVGVTLWRDAAGYNLLIPSSFASSLAELLAETAQQYLQLSE